MQLTINEKQFEADAFSIEIVDADSIHITTDKGVILLHASEHGRTQSVLIDELQTLETLEL